MGKQSISFVDRVRLASPDLTSAITTAMRFAWVAVAGYCAWMSFSHDLKVKWLALFAVSMTIVETYIYLYFRVRTSRVIIFEAAASVLAMLSLIAFLFVQIQPF